MPSPIAPSSSVRSASSDANRAGDADGGGRHTALRAFTADRHDQIGRLKGDPPRQRLSVGRLKSPERQRTDRPLLSDRARRPRLEPPDGGDDGRGVAIVVRRTNQHEAQRLRGRIELRPNPRWSAPACRRFSHACGADDARLAGQRGDGANPVSTATASTTDDKRSDIVCPARHAPTPAPSASRH